MRLLSLKNLLRPIEFIGVLLCTLLCLFSFHVKAQTLDEIGNSITGTQQFREALEISRAEQRRAGLGRAAKEIKGEPGIYILTKADIFSLGARLNLGYTDNPQATKDGNGHGSKYGSFAFSAGVSSKFPNSVDYGVNLTVSGVEYDRSDAPDSLSLASNTFIGKSFADGMLYASLGLNAGVNGSHRFNDTSQFYGLSATIDVPFQLAENVNIITSLSLERQLSDQDEQDSTIVSLGGRLMWFPTNNLQFSLRGSYSDRLYDNFFEDVTFVKRRDDIYALGIAASSTFAHDLQGSVSINFKRNRSTFFLSDYTARDTLLNLSLTKRF